MTQSVVAEGGCSGRQPTEQARQGVGCMPAIRRFELFHQHSAIGIAHGCGHETLGVHVDLDTDLRHPRLGEVLRGVPLTAVVIS
jgi:hypothetical protein